MGTQFQHSMLPQTTHDELARQNFVHSLNFYLSSQVAPGNKAIYEKRARPQFEQENHCPPQDRHEVRRLMEHQPYYRMWSALKRTSQEMLWDAVNTSVERQLPILVEQAKDKESPRGSLTLDPELEIPPYQTAVDIHCMPGGYHSEWVEGDITAGATYDRGVYIYALGRLGPLNDDLGQSLIQYLQKSHADFRPAKILDIGCSVGHSTLPYVDAYPEAEISAIDVAAPMLRYAHARAESLNKRVHFSQQAAEHTNFEAGSFDLIVSHILLHEVPSSAIRGIVQECHRLLAPGGMMLHLDAPQYHTMDPYSACMFDWETINNNEPFWGAMREMDLVSLANEVGFEAGKIIYTFIGSGARSKSDNPAAPKGGFGSRGNWLLFGAVK